MTSPLDALREAPLAPFHMKVAVLVQAIGGRYSRLDTLDLIAFVLECDRSVVEVAERDISERYLGVQG